MQLNCIVAHGGGTCLLGMHFLLLLDAVSTWLLFYGISAAQVQRACKE